MKRLRWHPFDTIVYCVKTESHLEDCREAYHDLEASRCRPLLEEIDRLERRVAIWKTTAWLAAGLFNGAVTLPWILRLLGVAG